MNQYKFKVVDEDVPFPLEGTVKAKDINIAQAEVLEWYAQDLGTTTDDLEIEIFRE